MSPCGMDSLLLLSLPKRVLATMTTAPLQEKSSDQEKLSHLKEACESVTAGIVTHAWLASSLGLLVTFC